MYESNVIRDGPRLFECRYNETVTVNIYPDVNWNNSIFRCTARNKTHIVKASINQTLVLQSAGTFAFFSILCGTIIDNFLVIHYVLKTLVILVDE